MKQTIGPLGEIELLTNSELRESLGHSLNTAIRDMYRAVKPMRLPLVQGTPSGSALSVDSQVGPQQGYAWDISMLGIAGLTTGTTPDVVNMHFNGNTNLPWWQFNGNNFAYTFSRGQLFMLPGETISLRNVGTFNATGLITLFGMIRAEVPAEKLGMIFG